MKINAKKIFCGLTALLTLTAASCSHAPTASDTAAQSAASTESAQRYSENDLTQWAACGEPYGLSIELGAETVTLNKGLTVKGSTLFSGTVLPVMHFTALKAGRITISTTPSLSPTADAVASKTFELEEGFNRVETEITVPYGCTLTFGAPGDTAVLAASSDVGSLCGGVTSGGRALSPAVKIFCSSLTEKLLIGEGKETELDPKLNHYLTSEYDGSAMFACNFLSGTKVTKIRLNAACADKGDTYTLNLVKCGCTDGALRVLETAPAAVITAERDMEDEWLDWEGEISVPEGWNLSFLAPEDAAYLGFLRGESGKTQNDRFLGFFTIKDGAISISHANQFLAMRIYGIPEPDGPEAYLSWLSQIEPPATIASNDLARLKTILEGKSLSLLGDSITTYAGISDNTAINSTIGKNASYYGSAGRVGVNDLWWQLVMSDTGMQLCVNNSWSGSLITSGDGNTWQTRCVNLHRDTEQAKSSGYKLEPDVILVYMGTNDYEWRLEVGDIDASLAAGFDADSDEPTTVTEAFYVTMKKMLERYPDADVFVMTPYFLKFANDNGDRLEAFNAGLKSVAERLGVDVIDLHTQSGYTAYNQCGYTHGDLDHPNEEGMKLIASCVEKALLEHFEKN